MFLSKQNRLLPMVEIFPSVQGEGGCVGYPTVFIRLFGCNLRCTWCDTKYSYAPAKPSFYMSIEDIVDKVGGFGLKYVCLTGGEPLLNIKQASELIDSLARLDHIMDIHVETNGAIDLTSYIKMRSNSPLLQQKVRFIMDFKLPISGEMHRMNYNNFSLLNDRDEIKFVIGSEDEFILSKEILAKYKKRGAVIFSPVFDSILASRLVELVLEHNLSDVRVGIQMHKVIWDSELRGV